MPVCELMVLRKILPADVAEKRSFESKSRLGATRSTALWHSNHFWIGHAAVPEAQQRDIGRGERQILRALTAVIKNVLVQQHMQPSDGNSNCFRCFFFGVELLSGSCRVLHSLAFTRNNDSFVPGQIEVRIQRGIFVVDPLLWMVNQVNCSIDHGHETLSMYPQGYRALLRSPDFCSSYPGYFRSCCKTNSRAKGRDRTFLRQNQQ